MFCATHHENSFGFSRRGGICTKNWAQKAQKWSGKVKAVWMVFFVMVRLIATKPIHNFTKKNNEPFPWYREKYTKWSQISLPSKGNISHLVFLSEHHQNIFKNIYANFIRKQFPKKSWKYSKRNQKVPQNFPSSGKYTVKKKTISEITIRVIQKASVQALTIND